MTDPISILQALLVARRALRWRKARKARKARTKRRRR
jgi:hypothetical protein